MINTRRHCHHVEPGNRLPNGGLIPRHATIASRRSCNKGTTPHGSGNDSRINAAGGTGATDSVGGKNKMVEEEDGDSRYDGYNTRYNNPIVSTSDEVGNKQDGGMA